MGQLEKIQHELGKQSDPLMVQLLVEITETVALALFNYGQRVQMLEWCNRALLVGDHIQHNPSALLIAKGRIEAALGNVDEAIRLYHQATDTADKTSLTYAQARLALLGITLNRGEYQQSIRDELDRIADLLRQEGHNEYIVLIDYQNAMYDFKRGNFDKALDTFLHLDNKLNEDPSLARLYPGTEITELQYTVWFAIGCIHRKLAVGSIRGRQRNYQKALEYLERLHQESKERFHSEMEAASAHHLSWIYLNQGDIKQALNFAQVSQKVYERLNRTAGLADVYEQLGLIHNWDSYLCLRMDHDDRFRTSQGYQVRSMGSK